jgi:hypothetical protein
MKTLKVLVLLGTVGSLCFAGPITVANNSFEAQVLAPAGYTNGVSTSWVVTGNAGTWYPAPTGTFFSGVPPAGNQVLAVGFDIGGEASQDLGVTLLPNTIYTLTYFVGKRLDLPMSSSYSVSLDAGTTATVLASDSAGAPGLGTFIQRTITFSTGASPVAGDLLIDIKATGLNGAASAQTDFDNFVLTSTSAVPEPATFSFIGIGVAAILFSRRRSRKA